MSHWKAENCFYAKSHSLDHSFHAAAGRASAPFCAQGEQRRASAGSPTSSRWPDSWSRCRWCRCSGRSASSPAFKFMEGAANNWIPSIGAGYVLGHRRHFLPAHHAHHAAGMDFDPLLVDRHRESRQGILHLVSGLADRHARRLYGARFLPLLRFLGSHAGPDVLADRHLGRSAQALRRDQILPLHAARLGADAARHPVPLFPPPHATGVYTFSIPDLYQTAPHDSPFPLSPSGSVPGVLLRLRHQGADVPLPHLAARCARRSAHGRLRDPGRRSAEDGNLRFHPLLAAVLSRMSSRIAKFAAG